MALKTGVDPMTRATTEAAESRVPKTKGKRISEDLGI